MHLANKEESFLKEFTQISPEDLKKSFSNREGITEQEIETNDKKDAYELRKSFKKSLQQFPNCLPLIGKFIAWSIGLCIVSMLMTGTFYTTRDEEKLLHFIWEAIWSVLIFLSSKFGDYFFKKNKNY